MGTSVFFQYFILRTKLGLECLRKNRYFLRTFEINTIYMLTILGLDSVRGEGSDLTTFENRSSRPPKMVQKWNFNFFSKFSSNFKQLLFLWQSGKNHFWTTFVQPKTKILPYIG